MSRTEVEVEGRRLRLSNLDKVFYPASGFTKGQVIDYYRRIAPWVVPHLQGRPITLKRYPNGVDGGHFYEKRCPPHRPQWVRTEPVWSAGHGRDVHYCVVDDLPTLMWAANLADLELHTSLSLAKRIEVPTVVAFDLDPGAPAGIIECCEVALMLRDLFDRWGMECFPKTSGSKGLQVYVPLNPAKNARAATYDETKPFARAMADYLSKQYPDRIVSNMRKELRKGKIFIDWSQNDQHKTTVNVYSLRAKEKPTVSTPLLWEEVEAAVRNRSEGLLVFEAEEVLARVEKYGDLFEPVLTLRQKLPDLS